MAALEQERFTERTYDHFAYGPLAADVTIFEGAFVVRDTAGRLKPAVTGTGLVACGRACGTYDNAGGDAGDVDGKAESGVFYWDNSAAADEITDAEIGDVCYLVDDHTVAKTSASGTRSPAGRVVRVGTGHQAGQVAVFTEKASSADGDLLAANNLSDVSSAATARANIGANVGFISGVFPLDAAGVYYLPLPKACTIIDLRSAVEGATTTTGAATITAALDTVDITNGVITIAIGAVVGEKDSATPSAANVATEGQNLRLTVAPNTQDAAAFARVTAEFTY